MRRLAVLFIACVLYHYQAVMYTKAFLSELCAVINVVVAPQWAPCIELTLYGLQAKVLFTFTLFHASEFVYGFWEPC